MNYDKLAGVSIETYSNFPLPMRVQIIDFLMYELIFTISIAEWNMMSRFWYNFIHLRRY